VQKQSDNLSVNQHWVIVRATRDKIQSEHSLQHGLLRHSLLNGSSYTDAKGQHRRMIKKRKKKKTGSQSSQPLCTDRGGKKRKRPPVHQESHQVFLPPPPLSASPSPMMASDTPYQLVR